MKHYVLVELEVTDPSWVAAYVQNVTKLIEQRGGRYLARTSNIQKLEGDRKAPSLIVLVEWPSKEIADSFYSSDEYRPYLQARLQGARSELMVVAGEDVTKRAQVPE